MNAENPRPPDPDDEDRCPDCNGGWARYTSGERAGERVPHCDPWCSLQGSGRHTVYEFGSAR